MSEIEFVDTNILVYCYDVTAGTKRERAKELVERLWSTGLGALSSQILQELYVNLIRKIPRPLPPEHAREVVADLGSWRLIVPGLQLVLQACDLSAQAQISFWDALVIGAAQTARAHVLWSEDLNPGQHFGSTEVRNPFIGPVHEPALRPAGGTIRSR